MADAIRTRDARVETMPMTPEQAEAGLLELVDPEQESVLVDIGDVASRNPGLEADVASVLLEAGDPDHVCTALRSYASASDVPIRFLRRPGVILVKLG
jgi:hypothetical protein